MSVVGDVFRVLRMPCREHHALYSRAMDDAVPRGVRIGLAIHAIICKPCNMFRAQLRAISDAAKRLSRDSYERIMESTRMPEDVRLRLRSRFNDG